jgi:type IV pilus assembly protein PilN
MLRINLLPIKAAKKGESARQELLAVMGGAIALVAGLYLWNSMVTSDKDETTGKIAIVKKEIAQLKQDVVKVEDFKKKAAALESKIKAIRGLQTRRIGPAKMLDDLATIMTEERKVWLTELTDSDGNMTLKGAAMEEENISDFQLALE